VGTNPTTPENGAGEGERPEARLLLACCLERSSDPDRVRRAASAVADWDTAIAESVRHRVLPLLHRAVRDTPGDAVPGPVRTRLAELYRHHVACSLALQAALTDLLAALRVAGLTVVVTKGPTLAERLLGDPDARSSGDVDLVVSPADCRAARAVLAGLGYTPAMTFEPWQATAYLAQRRYLPFACAASRVRVDLHTAPFPRYLAPRPRFADLAAHAHPRRWCGEPFLDVDPESLLVMLCLHGAKHAWSCLGYVADIAAWCGTYPNADGAAILARAREWHAVTRLAVGLGLAVRFGAPGVPSLPVPPRYAATARPAVLDLAARMFSPAPDALPLRLATAFHLQGFDSWRDRCRFCADVLLTPSSGDWQALRLPRALRGLHWVLRPCRLVARYALPRPVPA
jgi:hypothetical protein